MNYIMPGCYTPAFLVSHTFSAFGHSLPRLVLYPLITEHGRFSRLLIRGRRHSRSAQFVLFRRGSGLFQACQFLFFCHFEPPFDNKKTGHFSLARWDDITSLDMDYKNTTLSLVRLHFGVVVDIVIQNNSDIDKIFFSYII